MDENNTESDEAFADWQEVVRQVLVATSTDIGNRIKVIGISGSQGSGKSTLAKILVERLVQAGANAQAVSLDDFYLTQAERVALAARVHPLLRTRGVPGTHDVEWLQRVLADVRAGAGRITLPEFDKALDDRSGQRQVTCDVLVLEGWCLGVKAQNEAALAVPVNELERGMDGEGFWRRWVNAQIQSRYAPLWSAVDFWLQLEPPGFGQVVEWRRQQEGHLPEAQRMDEQRLRRFIEHYERLTRWQWACGPLHPGLHVALNADHGVARIEPVLDIQAL
jgi:D-glycerate 3-kinase